MNNPHKFKLDVWNSIATKINYDVEGKVTFDIWKQVFEPIGITAQRQMVDQTTRHMKGYYNGH